MKSYYLEDGPKAAKGNINTPISSTYRNLQNCVTWRIEVSTKWGFSDTFKLKTQSLITTTIDGMLDEPIRSLCEYINQDAWKPFK